MNVFIQGMRRSGTTILYDALLDDPELSCFYEPLREEKETVGGGSGARAVLTEMEGMFDANPTPIVEAPDPGHALQDAVLPVLRRHYDNFVVEVPGKPAGGATPATYVLAAGYAGDEPFIVDVDPHGLIGRYEVVGFHAVGSGAAMAQQAGVLLAQYRMIERSVSISASTPFRRIALTERRMISISCGLCARLTLPRWLSMML